MTFTPLLLILLLALARLLNLPIDINVWLGIFGLSLLVGVVVLVTLLVLRAKHKVTFSQPAMWLALVLACLDIAIPITITSIIFYVFRDGLGIS